MKNLIYLFLFTCLLYVPEIHAQEVPLPENKARYFDFWVGHWDVSWSEGENMEGYGTNLIEETLDGRVLQENFRVLKGKNEGFKGTSISVYNERTQTWHQAWADNNGGYFDFIGRTDGDKRIFQTRIQEQPNGDMLIQRMVFYDIKENSFTWDWESSVDAGENWTLNWRINYSRK